MPNWCKNFVEFIGEREKIKKLETFCGGMDFKKIVPMPETLGLNSGTMSCIAEKIFAGEELEDYEKYHLERLPMTGERTKEKPYGESSEDISYLFRDVVIKGESAKQDIINSLMLKEPRSQGDLYEMGRLISENKARYGTGNCIDWRYDNWGVKSEALDVYFENKGEVLEYDFLTAGNPPVEIMVEIIKYLRELSDIEMNWSYRIEVYSRGEYVLTEEGVMEKVYGFYDDIYNKRPEICGISFCLNVAPDEFAYLPADRNDAGVIRKSFATRKDLSAYIKDLSLVNDDFKRRLLRYVEEYDFECESVSYWGGEGITDAEPIDYYLKLSTDY